MEALKTPSGTGMHNDPQTFTWFSSDSPISTPTWTYQSVLHTCTVRTYVHVYEQVYEHVMWSYSYSYSYE